MILLAFEGISARFLFEVPDSARCDNDHVEDERRKHAKDYTPGEQVTGRRHEGNVARKDDQKDEIKSNLIDNMLSCNKAVLPLLLYECVGQHGNADQAQNIGANNR